MEIESTIRETILLVEDDAEVRNVLRLSLLKMGYRVLEAVNGRAALGLLEQDDPIDLLISDVVMEDIGGFELVSRLPRSRAALKVLYISGYTASDGGIAGDQILAPGTHFLRKPFSMELLENKVREVLES